MRTATKLALAAVTMALAADILFAFVATSGGQSSCARQVLELDAEGVATRRDLPCTPAPIPKQTFVEREGTRGIVLLAVPTVLTTLVLALVLSPAPQWLVWIPSSMLLVAVLLGAASIGLAYFPAAMTSLCAVLYNDLRHPSVAT